MTEPKKIDVVIPPSELAKVEPPKTEPPKTEPVKIAAPVTREVAICNRLGEILAEHGGLESNVPAVKGGEYWNLKAELNAIRTSAK